MGGEAHILDLACCGWQYTKTAMVRQLMPAMMTCRLIWTYTLYNVFTQIYMDSLNLTDIFLWIVLYKLYESLRNCDFCTQLDFFALFFGLNKGQ